MDNADTTSLILQLKAAKLSVDTRPLEAVLLNISRTLQSHEATLSKLPLVEDAQSNQRKELQKLRLALESLRTVCDDEVDAADESTANDGEQKDEDANKEDSSYGVRQSDILPIHQKHAEDRSIAKDEAVDRSLREVKASLRRLQHDRDEGLANSLELDEGLKSLKGQLFELQQRLASSANIEQMQALQRLLTDKCGQMESRLEAFRTSFHQEVNGSLNKNLTDVHTMCNDLQTVVKQRQTKLEQRVEVCAKEYDVASFRESVESDVAALTRQAAFLDDTAAAQGKTLVRLQQKSAIATFHRHYANWKQNALKTGLSRWKEVVKDQVQYEEGKESQKRLVRRLLTNIMSRRKRFGFQRWVRYRDWHRKAERRKLKATTLISEKLSVYLSTPKEMAFNRWRRLTLVDKLRTSREAAVVEVEPASDITSSLTTPAVRQPAALSMSNILDSFKGDVQGATYALAMEIESIKSQDIASLRADWQTENQQLLTTLHTTLAEAARRVEETSASFHEAVNERVDSCASDLPPIQSKLKELSNLLESSQAELKRVESSHKQRIDGLVVQEQQLDTRLSAVERQTNVAAEQIITLSDKQRKANGSIRLLRELITKNGERYEEERSRFQNALNHFGDELLKTKVALGQTKARCETLEKELAETKAELVHFQDTCQSETERVQRELHHPGIPKPSLDRIVSVGHAYETLAKERNYVTSINVTATLRETTASKMKRNGEQMRREEEVDVPSEIVAFAHDYANFVSYQSDHESLLLLIAGTNPEEQLVAEDDSLQRRKELCNELKRELGRLLEQASSYSVVAVGTDKSGPSSSRGMGLRWEARAIFLARVKDALEAALSKHDHVMLPAATRLGRVRPLSAAMEVCVACDRPMRRKGPRTAEGKRNDGGKQKDTSLQGDVETDESEERPQTAGPPSLNDLLQCGSGGTASLPRSSSLDPGKVIKASRLAEAMKENSDPGRISLNMSIG